MDQEELAVGKYLFTRRRGYNDIVYEIDIVKISKTSYHVRWESGSLSWMTKEEFKHEYKLLEKAPY